MISLLSITILALFLWRAIRILPSFLTRSRLPYPPGPIPKPLIGNVLDFPTVNASEKYTEWGRKYDSGIIHIEALGNHIIVINSVEIADELLEKRANIYSDRPLVPIIKLMGWEINTAIIGYNDEWRLHRRICQKNFRSTVAAQYHPLQTQKVHEMLHNLLERPEKFEEHNKTLSIAVPLSSMYGYEAKSLDDPCIKAADESATAGATLMIPGGNFIDIFPALGRIPAWVPGAHAVRAAAYIRQRTEEMKRIPMDFVRKQFDNGQAIPSLVTNMLERKFTEDISPEEEEAVQNIAYTVFSAASDTTIAVTKAFFHCMAKYPDAQRKAHAEIDQVVGSKRLPDFNDRSSGKMPYIEAIYREVLRIAPPLPLCVPHATTEDDHYNGYFIPKGATVFANIWGMCHDENRYPDPFAFKPERFLDASGQLNDDDRILAYGFGRRACVGRHVGSATFMMVSVLACFTIEKAKDQNGKEIEIDDNYEDFGLLRHQAKYECSFKVRSSEARQLILNTMAA